MKAAMVAIALVFASASARAQPTTGVSAVYHGDLVIKPARGRLDRDNGNAMLTVGPWPFRLSLGSNGIFPDQEAILIEIGEDPGFYLPPGMLRPVRAPSSAASTCPPTRRRGTSPPCPNEVPPSGARPTRPGGTLPGGLSFVYRANKKTAGPRAILYFRVTPQADGTYVFRFRIRGLDLSPLIVEDPICAPLAVIIGDDDGFSGVNITSPSFSSTRVDIPSDCDIGDEWPWIRE